MRILSMLPAPFSLPASLHPDGLVVVGRPRWSDWRDPMTELHALSAHELLVARLASRAAYAAST